MRRPHVYQRIGPRADRHAQIPIDRAATARTIAAQLGHIIDKADQGGLTELGDLLEKARIAAEREAGDGLIAPGEGVGTRIE